MTTQTITYKDQTFKVDPQEYQGNIQYWIYQNDQLVTIAYTREMIGTLIRERVDFPNWTAKAGSRYD